MDADNLAAWLAEVSLLSLLDGELNEVVSALVRGDLEAGDTASAVELADDGKRDGASKNGHVGSVLGDETGEVASIGQDNDEVNVQVLDGRDSRGGESLGGADWGRGEELDVVVGALVVNATLSFGAALAHDGDSLDGVGSVGRLSGEHDGVSAIKDSVGDIGSLSTGRSGVGDHGLEHLGGSDNGLGSDVSLLDHPFLGNEDLLGRDLHTKIATSDHDTVGGSEDLVVVVETFLVLDLRDDLNVRATRPKKISDVLDIVLLADEGGSDHIDALLEAKFSEILLILLSEGGQVNDGTWKVHVLHLADLATVLADNHDSVL